MKKNNRVPKRLLVEMLAILGLTMTRETFMDRRRWKISDGSYSDSLLAVFNRYRHPKDKKLATKIQPLVTKITRAIS